MADNHHVLNILGENFGRTTKGGHSMSNQHAKWTPVTDFAETW